MLEDYSQPQIMFSVKTSAKILTCVLNFAPFQIVQLKTPYFTIQASLGSPWKRTKVDSRRWIAGPIGLALDDQSRLQG